MPRVVNEGVSLHYRVEGSGPPLTLVHGITDSSDVFYERGYVAALKPKYRLVLIDARGHGQSDKPHDPQSYVPETCASDIVAVLDDLGLKTATYWGYSMGGRYGFALAQHALDRVACFVLGGASAGGERAYPAEPGNEDPLMTAFRGGPDAIIKVWGAEWMTPPLRERLLANDTDALIACLQGLRLNTEGYADALGRIAVPTLIYAAAVSCDAREPTGQPRALLPGFHRSPTLSVAIHGDAVGA